MFKGENDHEMICCIQEVFGIPPISLINQATLRNQFFDIYGEPKNYIGKAKQPGSLLLIDVLQTSDLKFLDFLESNFHLDCLRYEPKHRFSPTTALRHPWISEISKFSHVKSN